MLKRLNQNKLGSKILVIADCEHEFTQRLPQWLNIETSQLLVLSSAGAAVTQPYGCMVRNIILAIYQQGINQIYLIAPEKQGTPKFNQQILLNQLKHDGIDQDLLETIEYSRIVKKDVLSWLKGPTENVDDVLKASLSLLEKHPLIPERIRIEAFTVNTRTGSLTSIASKETEEDIC
ncbi:hypothetical protein [Halalkalibacter okhensis]|uniref:Carbonic anhydrase n=1 Tax=Halalkalibacter okhensis TaxID=333138 RepID=A0A0B0INT8_9BACI|nr:hypothetical protein [Halalkalibacter okhensis]KHF41739.1 hypothetical protein LQ50_00070 [Halalkalibacter okhensis]